MQWVSVPRSTRELFLEQGSMLQGPQDMRDLLAMHRTTKRGGGCDTNGIFVRSSLKIRAR